MRAFVVAYCGFSLTWPPPWAVAGSMSMLTAGMAGASDAWNFGTKVVRKACSAAMRSAGGMAVTAARAAWTSALPAAWAACRAWVCWAITVALAEKCPARAAISVMRPAALSKTAPVLAPVTSAATALSSSATAASARAMVFQESVAWTVRCVPVAANSPASWSRLSVGATTGWVGLSAP